ncbi:MAG: HypC/HybG/HupF family hydrogenase formation chaperone [Thermoplasmata archaeon]|nr:MAG: HypC/HybG/HupF family hydrogenase formation chaperone [Thermoplasmata archaeon]
MCLAVPGKIIDINEDKQHATVDYGDGIKRTVNISLVDAKIGTYVLVHAGFAIQTVDPKEAEETLELFREMIREEGG